MTLTTDPRRFLYRDNQLDPDTAQRLAGSFYSVAMMGSFSCNIARLKALALTMAA